MRIKSFFLFLKFKISNSVVCSTQAALRSNDNLCDRRSEYCPLMDAYSSRMVSTQIHQSIYSLITKLFICLSLCGNVIFSPGVVSFQQLEATGDVHLHSPGLQDLSSPCILKLMYFFFHGLLI